MLDTQLVQDPQRIRLAGGFCNPGQHQLRERRISKSVEPQPGVSDGENVPQQRGTLPRDHPRPPRPGLVIDPQVEDLLPRAQPPVRLGHQHRQLSFRACRPDMLDDVVPPVATLSDLHLRGARTTSRLPDEHHTTDPTHPRGTSNRSRPRP